MRSNKGSKWQNQSIIEKIDLNLVLKIICCHIPGNQLFLLKKTIKVSILVLGEWLLPLPSSLGVEITARFWLKPTEKLVLACHKEISLQLKNSTNTFKFQQFNMVDKCDINLTLKVRFDRSLYLHGAIFLSPFSFDWRGIRYSLNHMQLHVKSICVIMPSQH